MDFRINNTPLKHVDDFISSVECKRVASAFLMIFQEERFSVLQQDVHWK